MHSLRLIARLLEYPDTALWEARDEVLEALAPYRTLNDFAATLMHTDLLDAQAAYVDTFEYGRSTSLLLFEHVYGESRERGQAMVDLRETYSRAGWSVQTKELPDYLPLYLEYLSTLTGEEAKEKLGQFETVLSKLSARLHHRGSPYAVLFDALLAFCGKQAASAAEVADELPDNTPTALDAVWQEAEVRFGDSSPCEAGAPAPRTDTVQLHRRRTTSASLKGASLPSSMGQ
ncbi:MAG: nitrate reductase molybdenum cofactor assembly chaperone [Proteobacteria bacterium]|nr:nitrate reductase molybdenum cofactor assembly chaperone [Pseudomonadota bacterium]